MSFPPETPRAKEVWASLLKFHVQLEDGRILTVPSQHYPRLRGAAPLQLSNVRLTDAGKSINWPELDEDLSVAHLLCSHAVEVTDDRG